MEKDPTEETSWLNKQKAQMKKDVTDFHLRDCKECRYIGGGVMMLAGSYVGYVGQRRAMMKGGSFLSRVPSAVVAGLMLSLGILRLSGRNPFTSSESEIGIDILRKVLKSKGSDDPAS